MKLKLQEFDLKKRNCLLCGKLDFISYDIEGWGVCFGCQDHSKGPKLRDVFERGTFNNKKRPLSHEYNDLLQ